MNDFGPAADYLEERGICPESVRLLRAECGVRSFLGRPRHYHNFSDIGFYAETVASDYAMDFRAYRVERWDEEKNPLLRRHDDDREYVPISEADDAEVFLSGHIKWDSCSNFRFDAQDSCMLHFCSKDSAAAIGALLNRLYDVAEHTIPNWG